MSTPSKSTPSQHPRIQPENMNYKDLLTQTITQTMLARGRARRQIGVLGAVVVVIGVLWGWDGLWGGVWEGDKFGIVQAWGA
jgi:hypothetical protein